MSENDLTPINSALHRLVDRLCLVGNDGLTPVARRRLARRWEQMSRATPADVAAARAARARRREQS